MDFLLLSTHLQIKKVYFLVQRCDDPFPSPSASVSNVRFSRPFCLSRWDPIGILSHGIHAITTTPACEGLHFRGFKLCKQRGSRRRVASRWRQRQVLVVALGGERVNTCTPLPRPMYSIVLLYYGCTGCPNEVSGLDPVASGEDLHAPPLSEVYRCVDQ